MHTRNRQYPTRSPFPPRAVYLPPRRPHGLRKLQPWSWLAATLWCVAASVGHAGAVCLELLIQTMMAGIVEANIPFINTDWVENGGFGVAPQYLRSTLMCPGAFMGTGAVSFCLLSTVSCSKGDNIQVSFFLFVCGFCFICLFGLKEQNPTWDSSISCLWNSSTLPPPLLDTNPAPNGLEK